MKTSLPPWIRIVRETTPDYPVAPQGSDGIIRDATDIARLFRARLQAEEIEVFAVALLNGRNRVLAVHEVSRGTASAALVHPREVFRLAIAYGAVAIVLAHNHPSGDPMPSAEDIALTRRLRSAGEILGIAVLDHVIIGDGERFCAMARE